MQQLTFIKPGLLEWHEVAAPCLQGAGEALVRPITVATCDLDRAIVRGAAPFKGPFAFGHEGIAQVIEVGDGVTSFSPGQLVAVPFQISCGKCKFCLRGQTGDCSSVPRFSNYGLASTGRTEWGGLLSDVVRVPFAESMLLAVPAGIDPVVIASSSDNLPDAWRTVGPYLEEQPGSAVLIMGGGGGGSIGLYAVAIAVAMGAAQVVYHDTDVSRLELAKTLGASVIEGEIPRRLEAFPITVDASANPAGLACALRSTEPGGVCTSVGIYYKPETAVPLLDMFMSGITFKTGRAHARNYMPKILELVQTGRFHPELITSEQASWEDAAEAIYNYRTKLVISRT